MFVKPYLFGALTLLSASSALALTCANDYGSSAGCASNTTAAGDCATLGYSQDNVDGCEHYLYCPFDTSYKRCVSADYCYGYPLSSCPEEGANCSSCGKDDDLKFKIDSCENGYTYANDTCVAQSCPSGYSTSITSCGSGYTLTTNGYSGSSACGKCVAKSCPSGYSTSITSCSSGYTLTTNGYSGSSACRKCVAKSCSGYTLSKCPANGYCTDCLSGSTKKYKLNSCKSGYEKNGNTCVKSKPSCPSGYVPYSCRYDQLARLSECQEEGHEGCYIGTIDGVYYSIDRYDCRNGCCRECEC